MANECIGWHERVKGPCDLHAGHALAIPKLGQREVGEPQVLQPDDRFLAEEVVDAQDLALAQHPVQPGIQRAGRVQVVAKWLLDGDPASRLPHPLDGQRSLARAGLCRGLDGVESLQRLAGGLEIGVRAAGSADTVPVKLAAYRAEHTGDNEADVPLVKLLDDLDEDGPGGVIDVADGRAVQDHPP
jgi:hypothetical protein